MYYRLYVGGKLLSEGAQYEFLRTLADGIEGAQLVVMRQPVTDKERRAYRLVAWVAKHPHANAVDIGMAFNISMGGVFREMALLESAGLVTSELCIEQGFKQVRRYSAA